MTLQHQQPCVKIQTTSEQKKILRKISITMTNIYIFAFAEKKVRHKFIKFNLKIVPSLFKVYEFFYERFVECK